MKKAALIILLLLMLGGCGNNSELSTETVSETLPTSSAAASTETEDTATAVTTTATSATTVVETTVSEETTTEETTAVTEPKPPEPVIPPDVITIDVGKFYEGKQYHLEYTILDDENILVLYKFHHGSVGFVKHYAAAAKIFGISDGEEKAHIDIPETNADSFTLQSAEWYNFYRETNSDVCCAIYSCENGSRCINETVIYNDFTYESRKFEAELSYYDSVIKTAGDHMARISRYDNFYDMESGEIILNSIYEGEDSKSNHNYSYEFPIDENSFVYSVWGYEWTYGFGIYDYTTGEARDVPYSRDSEAICAHNGKIYFWSWDDDPDYGDPANAKCVIYAADVKTLETTPLFELDENLTFWKLQMTPDSSFLVYHDRNYEENSLNIYLYDPDTFELVRKYVFENTNLYLNPIKFIGGRTALLQPNGKNVIYVLDLNK